MKNLTPAQHSSLRDHGMRAFQLRQEIATFLLGVRDHGTPLDTGGGMGVEDIHVTVDGHQFHIQIRAA